MNRIISLAAEQRNKSEKLRSSDSVEPGASAPGIETTARPPSCGAAKDRSVAPAGASESVSPMFLGLTPQALCCRRSATNNQQRRRYTTI